MAKEAEGRLSKKELAAGDPDNDATLTKDEYLALVAKRFCRQIRTGTVSSTAKS